ncbi:MAG: hypothetical protein ACREJC_12745, partial [Tepidisphaeraceae bacterium]
MRESVENPDQTRGDALTRAALLLAIALVVARATMMDALREPFDVAPNSPDVPRGAGPASGVVLDLLCCAPALLVLLRFAIDRNFRLHRVPGWTALA